VTECATHVPTGGGGRFRRTGYFRLATGPPPPPPQQEHPPGHEIVRQEIFGPVVVARPFRNLYEIASEANNIQLTVGGASVPRTSPRAHALAKKLRAGTA